MADASAIGAIDTRAVAPWLNGSIETRFRTIDGLSIRVAESEERGNPHNANDRVKAVIRGEIELHPAGTKRRLTS